MSTETLLLIAVTAFCVIAMGAVSWLFYEVYQAASELVNKIDQIFDEIGKQTCSEDDIRSAVEEVNNTRP